jgi:hypothetical protein
METIKVLRVPTILQNDVMAISVRPLGLELVLTVSTWASRVITTLIRIALVFLDFWREIRATVPTMPTPVYMGMTVVPGSVPMAPFPIPEK